MKQPCLIEKPEIQILSTNIIDAPARVVPNIIWNAAAFAFRILVAIWFVPYLVQHLGTAAYGLIPLAVTITAYMTIATTAISSAVSRDLILSLTRGDDRGSNRVFNTALFGLLGLALVLTVPLTAISLKAEFFLDIPDGLENSATILFAWISGAFLLTTITSPFAASAIARHRLDLANGTSIVENIFRVGVVVAIFAFLKPDVSHVGMGVFSAAVIAGAFNFGFWRRLTPNLSIRFSDFSQRIFSGLTSTGSWVVVGHAGTLLLLSIDLILANRLFGAESGGRYALALQWALLLRSMGAAIAGTFTPTIAALFAEGDADRVQRMLRRAIKAVALFMAIPIGLTCGFAEPLLGTWLGDGFSDLAPLMILLVASLIISVPLTPAFSLALAADRVREFGIVTLLFGLANPVLSWILAKPCDWGMYGIAASSVILLAGRSLFYDIQLASRILSKKCSAYLLDLSIATVFAAMIWFASWGMARWLQPDSWFSLAFSALPVVLIFGAGAWFFLLNPAERFQLLQRGRR